MWIRKTSIELSADRRRRKAIGVSGLMLLAFLLLFVFYYAARGIESFFEPFSWYRNHLWVVLALGLVGSGLSIFGCRNFVLSGRPWSTQAKMICVVCKKELGCGEELGVVEASGRHRKWLKVRSCLTPEACVPVYRNEVKWVNAVKQKQYRG